MLIWNLNFTSNFFIAQKRFSGLPRPVRLPLVLSDFEFVIYVLKYVCGEKVGQIGGEHLWKFPC